MRNYSIATASQRIATVLLGLLAILMPSRSNAQEIFSLGDNGISVVLSQEKDESGPYSNLRIVGRDISGKISHSSDNDTYVLNIDNIKAGQGHRKALETPHDPAIAKLEAWPQKAPEKATAKYGLEIKLSLKDAAHTKAIWKDEARGGVLTLRVEVPPTPTPQAPVFTVPTNIPAPTTEISIVTAAPFSPSPSATPTPTPSADATLQLQHSITPTATPSGTSTIAATPPEAAAALPTVSDHIEEPTPAAIETPAVAPAPTLSVSTLPEADVAIKSEARLLLQSYRFVHDDANRPEDLLELVLDKKAAFTMLKRSPHQYEVHLPEASAANEGLLLEQFPPQDVPFLQYVDVDRDKDGLVVKIGTENENGLIAVPIGNLIIVRSVP